MFLIVLTTPAADDEMEPMALKALNIGKIGKTLPPYFGNFKIRGIFTFLLPFTTFTLRMAALMVSSSSDDSNFDEPNV